MTVALATALVLSALSVSGLRWGSSHPIHNYSICGNYTQFHTDGFILSPDMSLIQHENVNCTLEIRGEPTQMVTIHFEDFVIDTTVPHANDSLVSCGGFAERVSDCCLGAMLKVSELSPPRSRFRAFKGLPHDQVQQNIYCGSGKKRLPQPFLSAGSGVSLQFVSVANLAPKGRNVTRMFKLRYYVSRAGSDCGYREFQCQSDKKCIPSGWRCNQNRECEDGSDERDCSPATYNHPASKRGRWVWCDLDHILCGMHSKECFATSQRCNGVRDCSNGFDEDQCPPGSNYVLCKNFSGNATRCGSSQYCYDQAAQTCDGVMDCPLGDDERGCDPCPDLIRCGKHDSNYGGICGFNESQRCNGIDDCHDGFDEMNCLAARCGPTWGSFLCGDGRCISEDRRCDHVPDCSGAEDEMYCIKNSVITAAIMGSLVCGILVVIAISCTCRLYALRLVTYQRQQNCGSGVQEDRRRRSSISDSDLLRFDALQDLYCYYGFRDPPPPYSVAVAGDPPTIPPPPGTSGRRRRSRTHHTRMYTTRRSSNNSVSGAPVDAPVEQAVSQAEVPPTTAYPHPPPPSPPPQPVSPKPSTSHNAIQAPVHDECSQRDVREHLNKTDSGSVESSSTGEIEFSVLPSSNSSVIAVGADAASPTTDEQPLIAE